MQTMQRATWLATLGTTILILIVLLIRRHVVKFFSTTFEGSLSRHAWIGANLHIVRNIIPDTTVLLLAVAGLTYLMPDVMKRLEISRLGRRVSFVVLVFFCVGAIILNEAGRED